MLKTREIHAYGYAQFWALGACGGNSLSGD